MDTTAVNPPVVAPLGLIEKSRVLLASVIGIILLCTVGWVVSEPADPQMGITLATRWGRVVGVWPALMVLTAVAGVIGTVLAPRRLAEGGMFAASVGLAGLALKGGSMQDVLGYMLPAAEAGARRGLMALMALDTLLWTALLAVTWIAVALTRRWLWNDEELYNPLPAGRRQAAVSTEKPKAGWAALVITGLVAVFFIWLTITRTPVSPVARGQVIASVAAGFYLGAMAARHFTRQDAAHWYLLGVPAAALLGYLVAYLSSNMDWAGTQWAPYVDLKTTPPHELARPLPIEYLSVGVAATLAGFWSSERIEQVTEQEARS